MHWKTVVASAVVVLTVSLSVQAIIAVRRTQESVRQIEAFVGVKEPTRRVFVDSALAVACYSAGHGTLSCTWTPEINR